MEVEGHDDIDFYTLILIHLAIFNCFKILKGYVFTSVFLYVLSCAVSVCPGVGEQ